MSAQPETYRAVRTHAGWIDRSDRVRLELTGPDRARFLHNVTTNDVKRLPAGRGCEAFVTSLQGKTLGYVTLVVAEDRILLRTEPGGLTAILPHFQRYGVLEDVAWDDVSAGTFEFHLAGPAACDVLVALGGQPPAEGDLSHASTPLAGRTVRVVRESPTGLPGLTLLGGAGDAPAIAEALRAAGSGLGLVEIDAATFEALRIEAGTPLFGRDVTPDNLPQEVGRDARAINFVKGCYLGQETVARIDALGHVNKILKGARLDAADTTPPAPGTPLMADGKAVGTVTSAAFSPGWGCSVILAYVRVPNAGPGTELGLDLGGMRRVAIVGDLPMPDPLSSPGLGDA
jgi:folate-binding protein YgfZ